MFGDIRRRILDLGIIPGTIIKPVLKSPFSEPRAFEVRNTLLAIRKEDAEKIFVELNNNVSKINQKPNEYTSGSFVVNFSNV